MIMRRVGVGLLLTISGAVAHADDIACVSTTFRHSIPLAEVALPSFTTWRPRPTTSPNRDVASELATRRLSEV